MADLATRDRGQLILIAAFALAVTFVALALVVNSAIFTENLASRGETGGSADALTVRHDIERGVGRSIESANVYNTSDLDAGVSKGIGNVNTAYSKQHAAGTAIVNVSEPTSQTYGSRVVQNESEGRKFEDNSGNGDWVVMYGVKRVTPSSQPGNGTRNFEMNVSQVPISDTTAFNVTARNYTTAGSSADTWEMRIWGGVSDLVAGTTVNVKVINSTGESETCTATLDREYAKIDVTRGTVAGEPCDALRKGSFDGRFSNGVGQKYNITFKNGDAIKGNYSLVTANKTAATGAPNLNDSSTRDSPYVTKAIYDLEVDYIYRSPQLDYETKIRVAPGEPDD